jgi:hypothetical protein
MNASSHTRFALECLPARPEELTRSNLPLLLAAARGQRQHIEMHRTALIEAIAVGDTELMRALAAEEGDLQVSFQLLRPFRQRAEARAREVA